MQVRQRWSCRIAMSVIAVFLGSLPAGFAADAPVDFARDVAPLLEARCVGCHNAGQRNGELSLATAEDLQRLGYLDAANPASSYLLEVVVGSADAPPLMPKKQPPLSPDEVDILRRWVTGGAPWPENVTLRERSKADLTWWSLQPLQQPVVPAAEDAPAAWRAHPIDRFLWNKLAQEGLAPNPPADRAQLLRRLTYDLTGLPPTPEELADFANDSSPRAYEDVVDRLLASPAYGERWGRHWLDVIRFGESRGFERNEIILTLWPFRDYIIRSLNDDKPFDQLVREHLAGDVIGRDDPAVEVGVAFLVSGAYDDVVNQDAVQAAQIRANTLDDMIRATSEAFLGLTVGCARCHDHKFDPIRQTDYYSLYATFAGIRHGERAVATRAERDQRTSQLQPLLDERGRIEQQLQQLKTAAMEQAQSRIAEIEGQWVRPAVSRKLTEETFAPVTATYVKLEVLSQEGNPGSNAGYRIDEFEIWSTESAERNVALSETGATARGASRVAGDFAQAYSAAQTNDGRFGVSWIATGPELIVQLAGPIAIDRVTFSSDRTGAAGSNSIANFVGEYRLLVSDDGERWTEVANSKDRQPINDAHRQARLLQAGMSDADRSMKTALERQLAEVQQKIAAIPPHPNWWVGLQQPAPGPFQVFLGGDPQRPGPAIVPHNLQFLRPDVHPYDLPEADEGQRRFALAEWITDRANPLTPRVLANRLWHYHFGTGLVDTPSDFGYMGGRPTHPELLDWLALQLHEHDWHWKPVHKLIVMSQAYQQSADARPDGLAKDADARWLWRFPPRRLSAEELRDTMLAVSGKLNPQRGGPGFRLYQYLQDNVATYVPLDRHGPETFRRAIYHHNARASRVDLMAEFDTPDCAFAAPRRAATTTPLQALTLLNHSFTVDMANALSQRLEREAGPQTSARIERAFRLCFARPPSKDELAACEELVATHGLPALCRVLLNANELIALH